MSNPLATLLNECSNRIFHHALYKPPFVRLSDTLALLQVLVTTQISLMLYILRTFQVSQKVIFITFSNFYAVQFGLTKVSFRANVFFFIVRNKLQSLGKSI